MSRRVGETSEGEGEGEGEFVGPPAPGDFVGPMPPDESLSIAMTYGIPIEYARALGTIAESVGGRGAHLAKVIYAESRFQPSIVNQRSGATGLIQFMPRTAQALGTTTTALAQMSFMQQLVYVERYLKRVAAGEWAGPAGLLDNQYKMALAVFYPAWRDRSPTSVLPESAQAANPGIATVGDYVSFVLRQSDALVARRRSAEIGEDAGTSDDPHAA